jgi:hypothetical protein
MSELTICDRVNDKERFFYVMSSTQQSHHTYGYGKKDDKLHHHASCFSKEGNLEPLLTKQVARRETTRMLHL